MKFTKLNKLIATLVLSGTSVGAFATIGDTPYTLSQKNTSTTFAASSQKLAYLAVGFSMEMAYGHESEPANPTLIEVCNVKQDGSLTSCKDTGFKYNQYPNLRLVRPDTVAVNDKYIYISQYFQLPENQICQHPVSSNFSNLINIFHTGLSWACFWQTNHIDHK